MSPINLGGIFFILSKRRANSLIIKKNKYSKYVSNTCRLGSVLKYLSFHKSMAFVLLCHLGMIKKQVRQVEIKNHCKWCVFSFMLILIFIHYLVSRTTAKTNDYEKFILPPNFIINDLSRCKCYEYR